MKRLIFGLVLASAAAVCAAEGVPQTIPADYIARLYSNDMKSAEGRKRWHGAIVSNVLDEAAMIMRSYYESGYVHEEKARPKVTPRTPEDIAARKAKRMAELAARMPQGAAEAAVARETTAPITNEVSVTITPEVK